MKKIISNARYIALTIVVCGGCVLAAAQSSSKGNKETLSLANIAYNGLRFSQAVTLFEQCPSGSLSGDDMKKLADCYWQTRDYDKSLKTYLQYQSLRGEDFTAQEKFRIGEVYARKGDYAQANKWLENLDDYSAKAKAYSSAFLPMLKGDSLVWKIGYLNVNTGYREFAPSLYKQSLVFSSNRPLNSKEKAFGWDGQHYSRLWEIPVAKLKESAADSASLAAKVQNKKSHSSKNIGKVFEGADVKASPSTKSAFLPVAYTQNPDSLPGSLVRGLTGVKYNVGGIAFIGDSVIYFSANYTKANKQKDNRLMLMQGRFNGVTIDKIRALPFGEDTYSVMHPAVSPNGLIMVFSSDKKGGPGQFDLYYSTRQNLDAPWVSPRFVPGTINTKGNEVFPSITKDGYLYFSSDGKQGLGGLDIYRIKLENALLGAGEAEHLPSPVNSSADDFGWTQTEDGKTGYFTSDRNTMEDNIFSARYDEEAAYAAALAKKPRTLEGFVLDRQTMSPFANATIFLWNKCDNKVYVSRTDDKGKYSFPVKKSCEVVIVGASKGYSRDCLTMDAVFDPKSPVLAQKAPHDLLLDRYTQDMKWRLKDIHYNFDKSDIRLDARQILDSVVAILKAYPIRVELGSHTDSRGTFAYNDALSQRRAASAVAYIVSKGIDPSRITAKGYGERQLLNKCADGVPCSEAEHQANRRTEIKVLLGPATDIPANFDPSLFDIGQSFKPEQLPQELFDKCN